MKKFNIIKKSRKKSKGIDEKIEYLNKECQKTGLQEVMTTSNIYQGSTRVPNQDYNDFNGLSQGGYALGLSGADGISLGGAEIGINPSTNQTGVALSPPHPVTGQRRVASTVLDGTGSNRALRPGKGIRQRGTPPRTVTDGSAVWFFDPNYNGGEGQWYNFEWLDFNGDGTAQLGFWDTNFLGFFFHNTNLDQFQLNGVNIGTQIKNKIAGINFGTNGEIGEPQTIVLTQNDLGDPSFLPINIGEMSPQAYQYLLGKTGTNVASNVNYDVYDKLWKEHGIEAANWYENNPDLPGSSNPHINPLIPLPLELVQNDSRYSEPVSDTNISSPFVGAQDGDQFAFFGGNKNNNKTPKKPTKKTRNGQLDATKAATGQYTKMTPEIFFQKYGMSYNEYLNLP